MSRKKKFKSSWTFFSNLFSDNFGLILLKRKNIGRWLGLKKCWCLLIRWVGLRRVKNMLISYLNGPQIKERSNLNKEYHSFIYIYIWYIKWTRGLLNPISFRYSNLKNWKLKKLKSCFVLDTCVLNSEIVFF